MLGDDRYRLAWADGDTADNVKSAPQLRFKNPPPVSHSSDKNIVEDSVDGVVAGGGGGEGGDVKETGAADAQHTSGEHHIEVSHSNAGGGGANATSNGKMSASKSDTLVEDPATHTYARTHTQVPVSAAGTHAAASVGGTKTPPLRHSPKSDAQATTTQSSRGDSGAHTSRAHRNTPGPSPPSRSQSCHWRDFGIVAAAADEKTFSASGEIVAEESKGVGEGSERGVRESLGEAVVGRDGQRGGGDSKLSFLLAPSRSHHVGGDGEKKGESVHSSTTTSTSKLHVSLEEDTRPLK